MLSRIAKYPTCLTNQVRNVIQNPVKGHSGISLKESHLLTTPGETLIVKAKEIPTDNALWFEGIAGPCTFMGSLFRDSEGALLEARMGHFSASNNLDFDVNNLLTAPQSKGALSSVFIAGLSQITLTARLKAYTENIAQGITQAGLAVGIEWESPERPHLVDIAKGQRVSDIGLNLYFPETPGSRSAQEESWLRFIHFGITPSHSIIISTLFRSENMDPLQTHIITEESGVIQISHT